MRHRYRRPRLVILLLAALAATTSAAQAGDVVVMPFRCAVVDGRPVLTPADETGHRVLGKLEKQKVKTCSTVDVKRCRQWAAFKFDMDCGGARVPWMQVFANASEHTRRRVWERNGSLRVQDTPQRSKRIDDMCSRRMGVNQEWWSVNEICDEVSPLNPPKSTDLPAGFAPMVGLDAVFLPEEAIGLPPSRVAKAVPAAPVRAETGSIQAAAPGKPSAVANVKSAPAVVAPASRLADTTATADAQLTVVAREASGTPPPAPDLLPDVQAGGLATPQPLPTVVARNEEGAAERPPPAAAPAASDAALSSPRDAELISPVEPSGAVERSVDGGPQKANEDATAIEGVAAEAATGPAMDMIAVIIVALASGLLLATLLIVKWLGRADTSERAARGRPDLTVQASAADGFALRDGLRRQSAGSVPGRALEVMPRHHVTAAGGGEETRRAGVVSIGERMPNSRHEALELLGMGVASEGNIGSLKKIIDGLRMNWHPDLARDEADRQIRELRLKQINAAWDILGGKAAEA